VCPLDESDLTETSKAGENLILNTGVFSVHLLLPWRKAFILQNDDRTAENITTDESYTNIDNDCFVDWDCT
jgi:hypothetical protein